MTKVRTVIAVFALAIIILIDCYAYAEWSACGCTSTGIVLGLTFYTFAMFTIWRAFDRLLRRIQRRNEGEIYYGDYDYDED